MKHLAATASTAVLLAGSAAFGVATPAGAAGRESCWEWSKSSAYKNMKVSLWKGNITFRWCAQDNRITKFWMLRCDTSGGRSMFVRELGPDKPEGDCQPRMALGGRDLPIYGDMWVEPTQSFEDKFHWKPGKLSMHYELVLHTNGYVTGGAD
ncbi:hypothetical protein DMB66_30280 [Actinoplanes sp. ATCC 53533]|uniref:hypothetical protein n=1 Tax=Actinoplanes sp. ATCC 53533 TaxID=1288362 RepID=UPI000F76D16D|nr:hypothetical protein [Actinoplanes sp. ATCC 53533]RSM58190.1 hypothetical protein DMB66_30280 [Actinoplanes sp. ATCC 53533]